MLSAPTMQPVQPGHSRDRYVLGVDHSRGCLELSLDVVVDEDLAAAEFPAPVLVELEPIFLHATRGPDIFFMQSYEGRTGLLESNRKFALGEIGEVSGQHDVDWFHSAEIPPYLGEEAPVF